MNEKIKKEILRSIRSVELETNKLVDTLMSGMYRSIFLGGGIDFSELRHYYPGDDVRFIDWKASRKHNELYVRQFVEERESVFHFVFDLSKSMYFENKLEYALLLFASFMFYAVKNGSSFHLTTFGNSIKYYGRFRTRNDAYFVLGKLIDSVLDEKPEEMELAEVLTKLRVKSTHTLIFSDFMFDNFEKELSLYSRFTLDLVGFQVLSGKELDPAKGAFSLSSTKIVSDPKDLKYFIARNINTLKRLFAKHDFEFYTFDTGVPLDISLRKMINHK